MAYTNPSVGDFKIYFTRDFPYGPDPTTSVTNDDITSAMQDCAAMINVDLFSSQENYNVGFLNLSAHFMVMSLRASSQGISGQYSWLQNSRGVGSVSESVAIPQRILDNPEYAMLTKTNYGAKFLFMVLPALSGQVFVVCGRTLP